MAKQPIVPLEQFPVSRQFEKKEKNELIFRCRCKDRSLSFYVSIPSEQATDILDKVYIVCGKADLRKCTILNDVRPKI